MATLTVCIGNSDDKLSQAEWAAFWFAASTLVRRHAEHVFGEFASLPMAPFQNAAWVISGDLTTSFREALAGLAQRFRQDSIAVVAGDTVMVGPPLPGD